MGRPKAGGELTRKFSPGGWSNLRRQIDDYFYQRFVQGAVDRGDEVRIRNTRLELEDQSTTGSWYLLYRLPADEKACGELEDGLRELKRDYPSLIILGLTGDADVESRERSDFRSFRSMLPMRETRS